MASVIEICNIALARIGNSRTMNSLEERTKEAAICKLFFEPMRDAVLSDFDWNFAAARVVLADLGDPVPGWDYRYQYPTDCMKITEILPKGMRYPLSERMRIQFEVGSDAEGTGKVIHTNEPQATMLYVKQITDPNMFDAVFRDALAWRLAAEISMPITANADMGTMAQNRYAQVLGAASARSMNEGQEPVEPMSELASVRLC